MKKYLLALCLASVTYAPMMYGAAEHKHRKSSSSSSSQTVCPSTVASATASSTTEFDLTTTFRKIPFTENVQVFGTGIQAVGTTDFELDRGKYLVAYSNTEEKTSATSPTQIDYAVVLGNTQVFQFVDKVEQPNVDNEELVSFSVIVSVLQPSVLSIQARIDTLTNSAFLGNRTLAIVKLS